MVVNSPEEDDRQWHLRLYESQIAPDVHKTYNPEKENYDTWSWCRPAEDVWPNVFLAVERKIAKALRNERDLHYRQIRWLCARLQEIGDRNGSQECPPSPHGDCRIGNCAECWELASLEAVKEGADGTSEESPALGR